MSIVHQLSPRAAQVGGFSIDRLLPQRACRKVGPWVFLDRFGPASSVRSARHDVLPHPHCGLSTVSYLFAGSVEHRDSAGGHAIVRPGEIHWMRGGHGIVHSERVPRDEIGKTGEAFGLQLWCAHPDGEEEQDPRFDSWTELPVLDLAGVRVRLLAGTGWEHESPVDVTSPLVYAVAELEAGQRLSLPDHEERCVYPVLGEIAVEGVRTERDLIVVDRHAGHIEACSTARVVILGGDAIGPRFIWWNLVHSDQGRLREQAERWRRGEFPSIPGDDVEFIPAPQHGP
jgi:redox-sensitive bicupin YhaK (pirin superfamily)